LIILWPAVFILAQIHRKLSNNDSSNSNSDSDLFGIEKRAFEGKMVFCLKVLALTILYVATNYFIVLALGYIPNTKEYMTHIMTSSLMTHQYCEI